MQCILTPASKPLHLNPCIQTPASKIVTCGSSHKLCKKDTDLVSASTTIGGVAISALMMSWGTEALTLINLEIMEISALSMPRRPSVRMLTALMIH